jgi:hypothetical protein
MGMTPVVRTTVVATTLAAGTLIGGCAADNGRQVLDVARAFYEAHAERNGQAACALLAPATVQEIEQSTGSPCEVAVLEEELPDAGDAAGIDVWGNQAQVRFAGDTAFLAEFPGGWKVIAAACQAQPEQPYECRVTGA